MNARTHSCELIENIWKDIEYFTRGKMFETVEVRMVKEEKAKFHFTEIEDGGGNFPSHVHEEENLESSNYKNSTSS